MDIWRQLFLTVRPFSSVFLPCQNKHASSWLNRHTYAPSRHTRPLIPLTRDRSSPRIALGFQQS
jgi:hypothetical protein